MGRIYFERIIDTKSMGSLEYQPGARLTTPTDRHLRVFGVGVMLTPKDLVERSSALTMRFGHRLDTIVHRENSERNAALIRYSSNPPTERTITSE